jgi:K+-dependent Na+/Ca+ exchanger-like protein
MAVPRRRRRLARKYSQAFLLVALSGIALWHTFAGASSSSGRAATGHDELRRRAGLRASAAEDAGREEARAGGRRLRLADMGSEEDLFSEDQRKSGAMVLHCCGLFYMFVAIAIVCDECFVPSLEAITEVLHLTPDVAGATFMAAGGSAPEFFTSLFSAISPEPSLLGTGTIIGSAVFNVLFVIGCCAAVSPEPLKLTWFPLARDSTFYAVDLVAIVCFFNDEEVRWWEALCLFGLYLLYASFMVKSEAIERWFKGEEDIVEEAPVDGEVEEKSTQKEEKHIQWASSRESLEAANSVKTAGTGEELDTGSSDSRNFSKTSGARPHMIKGQSTHSLAGGDRKIFRHQSLRVVNTTHVKKPGDSTGGTIGGLPELNSPTSQVSPPSISNSSPSQSGVMLDTGGTEGAIPSESSAHNVGENLELCNVVPSQEKGSHESESSSTLDRNGSGAGSKKASSHHDGETEKEVDELEVLGEEDEEDDQEPLTLAPPGAGASVRTWASYILTLPIVFILVITVPDVRRGPISRKFFVMTFCMSIVWIACFTWVMVFLARVIAETVGMKEHIMGITILAAGTSVPDLLTSMLVAREGQGDMAVSSSIGSNIFDVTVGLPVPWLISGFLNSGRPNLIQDEALQVSVLLLLCMLGLTIGIIKFHHWEMTRWMGGSMLTAYFLFLVIAVLMTQAPKGSLKFIKV